MRSLFLMLAVPAIAFSQSTATVTVYTPGGVFKGAGRDAITLSIGKNDAAPSQGWIFDGAQNLTKLMPHQYATFQLPAGDHDLSASNAKKPSGDAMHLTLEPNKHYFVQFTTTKSGASIVQSFHSHLAVVSCEQARAEADTNKPVKIRLVDKSSRATLVDGSYFPRCE